MKVRAGDVLRRSNYDLKLVVTNRVGPSFYQAIDLESGFIFSSFADEDGNIQGVWKEYEYEKVFNIYEVKDGLSNA